MEFIRADKPHGCIFCEFPAQEGLEADRRNLILGRSARSFAIFNRFPYSNGHLMVIPRRHTCEFESLSAEESADLHGLVQTSVGILKQTLHPDGLNVGMNLGLAAGAGIADHLHYHLVPRWNGDTNFMPVVSQTKVIVEHLEKTYDSLRPIFDRSLSSLV